MQLFGLVLAASISAPEACAQAVLSGSSYSQNFDAIGSGLPEGWSLYVGATADSLGSPASFDTTELSWADTGGAFKNLASSAGLASTANASAQAGSDDRSPGIRQTGTFGDPGAAFVFHFDAGGCTDISFTVEAHMLGVQSRSTDWSFQWSINGTNWNTVDTWGDPGAFGVTGLGSGGVVAGLAGQASGYIRFAALSAATGSGSRDSIGIDNFAMAFAPIPEPSACAAASGLLALAAALLRRRRKQQP